MFEKVNPAHPDKVADRIAGAIVDLAYRREKDPRIAVEVLLGHGECNIIIESSVEIWNKDVQEIVYRIAGEMIINVEGVPQDRHLADNQAGKMRCGDNGIFCGAPVSEEQRDLTEIAKGIYREYRSDGKYILDGRRLIICQSRAEAKDLKRWATSYGKEAVINPLGYWTGGTDVDSGATNRKLGSDMGDGVTGGGLHGKDLTKADVSVNIFAHLLAQGLKQPVRLCCAIGDEDICGIPYEQIVEIARSYIKKIGGFEKFAEWGLIR